MKRKKQKAASLLYFIHAEFNCYFNSLLLNQSEDLTNHHLVNITTKITGTRLLEITEIYVAEERLHLLTASRWSIISLSL